MRIDKVYIEKFKNLKKFNIHLDERQMNTVLLGENATGKSNFLEALVLIFKFLDISDESNRSYPDFLYRIEYKCRERNIKIEYAKNGYEIYIDNVKISLKHFFSKEGKREYLPKYVFTYYSGLSDRLDKIFWQHQNNFYKEIIKADFDKAKLDDLRRLFYVKQIHSFFVLLAFFSLPKIEKKSKEFLYNILGIEDLESVLFVLKKPTWENEKGDERFWGARGLVQEFLSTLWDYSLAPIYHGDKVYPDFRSKGVTQERLYLYISNKENLKLFAKKYFDINQEAPNNTFLFKALESTYISELLEEVKVRVKKKTHGEITFKELSEGEQQLLTVIGLLIFTREDESLVLLDEPDTHLNPIWKYDYLYFLKSLVKSKNTIAEENTETEDGEDRTTQILINTHDPLVIGSMEKSQVRMFGKNKIKNCTDAIEPDVSPRGLGVAGILTSELFGLKSIIDRETQGLLDERNLLMYKESKGELTEEDKKRLQDLFEELSIKGFNHTFKDPLYSEYIINKMNESKG
ncbi:MAG TPA: AAA family ATPase [Bacteroidia bacterium]|jgi:ABC-type multidrug transport system ATPase subunit|nr:AAA family ATPase [Bacteroidia bacterium]